MIEYTQEELWELASRMPDSSINPALNDIRFMHGIDAQGWILDPEHVLLVAEGKNIQITPYDRIPDHLFLKQLLYELPLENMPLMINNPINIVRIIATWRLAIAR
jgi:hypothetical protein